MPTLRAIVPRLACAFGIVVAFAATAAAQAPGAVPPTPSDQRFKAGTELVLVDVTVVDGKGTPVPDLGASDFSVSVAGRPRPVRSVQFVTAPPASPPSPRDAGTTTNVLPTTGRPLLIVVDEDHLRSGANRAVLTAAQGLMARLAPGDLVGVARLPEGGGVEFTTDRKRVADGLARVTGRPPRPRSIAHSVYLSEAVDYEAGGRLEWPRALLRECGPPGLPGYILCFDGMRTEATDLLRYESMKAANTVRGLETLMKHLEAAHVPVTIVLISEGLFLEKDPGLLTGLSSAAGSARVSVYVVKPAAPMFDIGMQGMPADPSLDEAFMTQGIKRLARQFRGGYFEISGGGAAVFNEISTELSGYYLVGIEPTDEDRTERTRRLRVEVKNRKGLSVRARPAFSIADHGDEETMSAQDRLRRLLASPIPSAGLPLKVASYSLTGASDARVRVLLSAEVGERATPGARHQIGLVILNGKGEVVVSTSGDHALPPARIDAPSPALFVTSVLLDPGDYVVRLGAVDADGRTGSVQHDVHAALVPVRAGLHASDLIVAPEPVRGAAPRVNPSGVVEGERVALMLEARGNDGAALERASVRFEVAASERGAAMASVEGLPDAKPAEHRRLFSAVLPLDALPGGEYTARAVIAGADPVSTITRPFRFEPVRAPATVGAQVLERSIVGKFVDELQKRGPVSPALTPFVERARTGAFADAPAADQRSPADRAMVLFVNGLASMQANRIAAAQVLFQQASREAPGFGGAGFYLGACHAIAGRYRDAVAAVAAVIDERPEDSDALFLGLRVLHDWQRAGGLPDEERDRFPEWASRYEARKGPDLRVVLAWKATLMP